MVSVNSPVPRLTLNPDGLSDQVIFQDFSISREVIVVIGEEHGTSRIPSGSPGSGVPFPTAISQAAASSCKMLRNLGSVSRSAAVTALPHGPPTNPTL